MYKHHFSNVDENPAFTAQEDLFLRVYIFDKTWKFSKQSLESPNANSIY